MERKKKNVEYYNPLSCLDNLGADNKDVAFLLAETKKYPSIRNIGVIGPYGSGKSSVVHSFIKLKDKKYKRTLFFSQETLAEHLKKEGEVVTSEEFKKAIYCELLKYDTKSILLNSYLDSVLSYRVFKWLRRILFFIATLGLCFVLFWLLRFTFELDWVLSIAVPTSVFVIALIVYLSFVVKKISVAIGFRKTEIKGELSSKTSVDDLYEQIENHPTKLDNLVLYILSKNKIKYFVIEDLERLNDKDNVLYHNSKTKAIEIIKHFKMLSDLVERSKIVKNKIVFIYGLNEECFDNSESRSKFFDLIVPVIPISTYSSAAQAILDNPTINALVANGRVDKKIIHKLSLYFENQRQINSLLAQFYLSHNKLSKALNRQELFAICSLMVLFPKFSHGLFKKDNDLDLLISNEWSVMDTGECSFISSRKFFPKNVSGNLAKFLKTCINDGLITKGYRYCLTLHDVADDKMLSLNDLELLKLHYSGVDISSKEFDNPAVVLDKDENSSLFDNINSIHPQIVGCLLLTNENDKIKSFKVAFDSADNEKSIRVFTSIIEYNDEAIIDVLCSSFVDRLSLAKCISHISEEKKDSLAYYVLKHFSSNFLINQEHELKDFYLIINGEEFINHHEFEIKDIEKVLHSSKYCPQSIKKLCESDKNIATLFRDSLKFELSFDNIYSAFPTFKEKPFSVLSTKQELCSKMFVDVSKSSLILESCGYGDNQNGILTFLRRNSSSKEATELLTSNYFNNWQFKIVVEDSRRISPLPLNVMQSLLGLNLLDLNSAYSFYFESNDPSGFDKCFINNLSAIKSANYKFDSRLSIHLIKTLNTEDLKEISKQLDCTNLPNEMASMDYEKVTIVYPCIDETLQKEITAGILKTNESLFKLLLSKELIKNEHISDSSLSPDVVAYIFDNNLRQYYTSVVSSVNQSSFESLASDKTVARQDFAKLIFDDKGLIIPGICPSSLAKICELEIDNEGCLLKTFEQADDNVFSDKSWKEFIATYVKKFGNIDSHGKYSLNDNELGRVFIRRLSGAGIICEAKGTGKNKLYFKVL